MDIFFQDPDEVPLPPQEVKIRQLEAEPWSDGTRVHIYLEVDPFLVRPNIDLDIHQGDNPTELTSASIIESMTRRIEINLHIPGKNKPGKYNLKVVVSYASPLVETKKTSTTSQEHLSFISDQKTIQFEIQNGKRRH